MATALPQDVTYGYVADKLLRAVMDTPNDPDHLPDGIPAEGTVSLIPVAKLFTAEDGKTGVIGTPYEFKIHQGVEETTPGAPVGAEHKGLLVNPATGRTGAHAVVAGWYNVAYRADGYQSQYGPFHITPEHTEEDPFWVRENVALEPTPQTRFVVNEAVYTQTLAARDEVRDTLAGLSDPLDTAVDATLTNPDSASYTSLMSTIATGVDEQVGGVILRSRNLFDKDDVTHGVPSSTRAQSGFIPVEPSTDYIWSRDGQPTAQGDVVIQRFNADHEAIGGYSNLAQFTTTSATRYIQASVLITHLDSTQLDKGTTPTPYMPFGGHALAPSVKVPAIDALAGDVADHGAAITDLLARVETLEDTTAPAIWTPDSLLVWEELADTGRFYPTAYDGAVYGVIRTSADGTRLRRSTDAGITFTAGFPVSALDGASAVAGVVFEDGTVSILTAEGKFYHADAFDSTPTLAYETTTGNAIHTLPINSYQGPDGEQYVFAGEYDATPTQKTMYYSRDGGRPGTWGILKEGDTFNTGNNHWHAVAYDPYTDSVWLSQGDGDNSRIYYTPDWGDTWHHLADTHPTAIHAFAGRVVFGRDKSGGERPGMDYWVPGSEPAPTTLHNAITFRNDRASFDFYPTRTDWSGPDSQYYMMFPARHPEDTDTRIYGTGDSGRTWHLVYKGPDVDRSLTGISGGYLFARQGGGSDAPLFRAKAPAWVQQ